MRTIVSRSVSEHRQTFKLYAPAEPISVTMGPGGAVMVHFLVDASDKPLAEEWWEVEVYKTGGPCASKREYFVGTVQAGVYRDWQSFHVFARVVQPG